ncbi:MAG: hypothetical protein AAB425_05880, partial [Bdellovibrionota bacterium]
MAGPDRTFFQRVFWGGLCLRLLIAPFLRQWYHADERQLLEFAHFHAHGTLHPFLEAELQMRNQTVPWLLSLGIRILDFVGLQSPAYYEWLLHYVFAVWSWLGLWALIRWVRDQLPEGAREARVYAVATAIFWAYPMLFSRGLSEAISFTPAAWTWYWISSNASGVSKKMAFLAGIAGGATSILRYPSGLFAVGAALLEGKKNIRRLGIFSVGLACVVLLGGMLDLYFYDGWLRSLFRYWDFNRPGGRVSVLFG